MDYTLTLSIWSLLRQLRIQILRNKLSTIYGALEHFMCSKYPAVS